MDKKRNFVTITMHTTLSGQTKTFVMRNWNLIGNYLRLKEHA